MSDRENALYDEATGPYRLTRHRVHGEWDEDGTDVGIAALYEEFSEGLDNCTAWNRHYAHRAIPPPSPLPEPTWQEKYPAAAALGWSDPMEGLTFDMLREKAEVHDNEGNAALALLYLYEAAS